MTALDYILDFVTAFMTAAAGVIVGVSSSGYQINHQTWIVACATGTVVGMKEVRATRHLPPLSNGNLEALKQLYASQPKIILPQTPQPQPPQEPKP